jgi:hypothetical protein
MRFYKLFLSFFKKRKNVIPRALAKGKGRRELAAIHLEPPHACLSLDLLDCFSIYVPAEMGSNDDTHYSIHTQDD